MDDIFDGWLAMPDVADFLVEDVQIRTPTCAPSHTDKSAKDTPVIGSEDQPIVDANQYSSSSSSFFKGD